MNTPDNWLTNVEEIVAHKDNEICATQVKNTSSVAMESLEVMWPIMNGTIKVMSLNEKNGFGFITPTEGGKDIFFHSDTCTGGIAEFKTIFEWKEKGKKFNVTFNVQNSPKGPMAVNVSVAQ